MVNWFRRKVSVHSELVLLIIRLGGHRQFRALSCTTPLNVSLQKIPLKMFPG
jgi:hypothetical protein